MRQFCPVAESALRAVMGNCTVAGAGAVLTRPDPA